ncbi:unnamed protein product [Microthlaspi erraticum]|uniref:RRM domain-containing protein n=1 Tax=Microthlaspi erraticum TaxID=1685480 RepID=A0A6D2IWV8_9BRAS|nr:unnamed protein product [Microthlaspi erraticum]
MYPMIGLRVLYEAWKRDPSSDSRSRSGSGSGIAVESRFLKKGIWKRTRSDGSDLEALKVNESEAFSSSLSYFFLLRRPKRKRLSENFEMSTGLDMSLDDMIAKNRKSRGAGPTRGSGSGPGPTRRNNPNRKTNRSAPYQSSKAPESTWEHDMYSDRSEGLPRSGRSSAGIETGTKLYLSNLDYGVMNDDIKELFAEVGELKRYTVHFDRSGRSKGTAEVVFSRRGDALAAVKKYNEVQLDGKPMKIEIVGTNPQTAAAPGNGNSNGAARRGGQGRGGQQRGGGRRGGGGGRGGGGRGGRRPGKGPAEKLSAEDLDADLDKYHSGDMETN